MHLKFVLVLFTERLLFIDIFLVSFISSFDSEYRDGNLDFLKNILKRDCMDGLMVVVWMVACLHGGGDSLVPELTQHVLGSIL